MKKTVLIFGISSFVGSNLAQFLKDDFRVIGTYHQTAVDFTGITCMPCDVLKKDPVNKIVAVIRPDITIYAVGLSSLSESMRMPKLAEALNSLGAANVCRAAERFNSKFVYVSSCFISKGQDVPFKEGDTPMPQTMYGQSIASTEFFIQRSCINYLILRSCPLYGWSYGDRHANWFETVQRQLAKGEPFEADTNVKTGYLDIAIFARILKGCIDLNVTNRLLQVSSQDLMSRAEFAQLMAKVFRKEASLIQGVPKGLPGETEQRKAAGSAATIFRMDTSNLEGLLGVALPRIEESVQFTLKRLGSQPSGKSS